MNSGDDLVTDALPIADEDESELGERLLKQRLSGQSYRAIARQHGLAIREVQRLCAAALPAIDESARRATLQEEIARLNALLEVFFRRARDEGDCSAAMVYAKLSERKSCYLGLDVPIRTDPGVLVHQLPTETSTEKVKRVLDAIAGARPPAEADGSDEPRA
jgi:hypothetical protein